MDARSCSSNSDRKASRKGFIVFYSVLMLFVLISLTSLALQAYRFNFLRTQWTSSKVQELYLVKNYYVNYLKESLQNNKLKCDLSGCPVGAKVLLPSTNFKAECVVTKKESAVNYQFYEFRLTLTDPSNRIKKTYLIGMERNF